MSEISTLQPALLWQWFAQICAIPHPSHHEDKLAEFIVDWAKKRGFFVERDEVGNLLIRKAASAGMEHCIPVALQAHLDMVPQANEGSSHNFEQDPIRPHIVGDWVKAQGTTLGADNGIGLASALAILESDNLAHPPLEVLLTMTEETGMDGAIHLRNGWLQSEWLINTDTEEIGEIYIGCAGGINANLEFPIEWQANSASQALQINLKGLRGGHSGCDIHTGRANAIKLLARLFKHLQLADLQFNLAEIHGGSIRNAIPREAGAIITFCGNSSTFEQAICKFNRVIKEELALVEPNVEFSVNSIALPQQVFTAESQHHLINALNLLPNGVIRNSDVITGVVESSLSVGVLKMQDNTVKATILVRSLIESGKQYITELLSSLADLSGAKAVFSAPYPGWQPVNDSALVQLTEQHYQQVLGKAPLIKVIHAGLECGLLKQHYPHIEMVSIGPTIRNAHSPDEQVNIADVQTYWTVLTQVLANIPHKA